MKYPIPPFLRPGAGAPPEAELVTRIAEKQLSKLHRVSKAEGYIEAVTRLRKGLAKCPSPALLELLEPYLRDVFLGLEFYEKEAEVKK